MTSHSYCSEAQRTADDPTIDELDSAIRRLALTMNAETYRLLMLVRDFDDRFGWAKAGFRNCAEWLAYRCEMTLSTAREKVRTAQALREMPAISAAFAAGRLSYSKVRALTRVVEYHNEEKLLAYALEITAAQLEERCREILNGRPESVGGAWRAWERRSLTLRRDQARGTMCITVEVPIEDGEVIAQALERAVEAGEAAIGLEFAAKSTPAGVRDSAEVSAPSGNGWLAQQADGLVAIAKAYLSDGRNGNRGNQGAHGNHGCHGNDPESVRSASVADHYQVVVHVDESALRGGAGRSDLPIESVKRLCCDGSRITIVEDANGTPLHVGRKRRTVSTALKRALWARDRGCTFPGCHHKRYVDSHHIRHWADGGDTSLPNTALLCTHHHRLVHEGGFKMRRDEEGTFLFQRPDGRMIPRRGYRLEDMVDDFEEIETKTEADTGIGTGTGTERKTETETKRPSAEVREVGPPYSIAPLAPLAPLMPRAPHTGVRETHAASA